jgi:hypothetical protein
LPEAIVSIHFVDNRPALGYRQRQWFFTVDVFARAYACKRKGRMPMIWGGYAKRVNVGAREQFSKIVVLGAIVIAVMCVYLLGRIAPAKGINVANGDYLTILFLQETFDVTHPHAAQADKAHRQSVARRRPIARAES